MRIAAPADRLISAVHRKAQYMARDMTEETKEATITIRVRPSVKAKAVKRAHQEGRSLANYIERLIEHDAKEKLGKQR
jgi:predicted HicB family RNase H-like nuclease